MIKHKAWQEPKDPEDGIRLLTMAIFPRGQKRSICDVFLPQLAPDADKVQAYRRGELSWAAFSSAYRAKLKQPDQRHVMELLATLCRNFSTHVTVMCGCDDPKTCHRTVLVEAIQGSYRHS